MCFCHYSQHPITLSAWRLNEWLQNLRWKQPLLSESLFPPPTAALPSPEVSVPYAWVCPTYCWTVWLTHTKINLRVLSGQPRKSLLCAKSKKNLSDQKIHSYLLTEKDKRTSPLQSRNNDPVFINNLFLILLMGISCLLTGELSRNLVGVFYFWLTKTLCAKT